MSVLCAVTITQNEERNITRCLKSVQFADEIVVVDALSKDRTVELAHELGARVIHKRWQGFAAQKQFAIDHATSEWILLIDADEEVTAELAHEISQLLSKPPMESGFRIRRRNQFLGKWMRHGPWARDFQTRLFRKTNGRIARRPVHEGVQIDGDLGMLQNPLNHFTHQTLAESAQRLNRYTSLEATERVGGRKIRLFDAFVPPIAVFLRYYLVKGCWKAGVHGFLLASITAMYKSVLYLKIHFLQRERHVRESQ
ncbi:MAG: glycosyltransferase family 2 protein [Candidatus Krumholzibacteria bacterium]|nr:glycosyltransferase family 2 protein [Candidatus Krumholzibacteria bacterium]